MPLALASPARGARRRIGDAGMIVPRYLPSFTEGSPLGMKPVIMDRFFDTASRMMSRRHKELTPIDKEIYINIREQSAE